MFAHLPDSLSIILHENLVFRQLHYRCLEWLYCIFFLLHVCTVCIHVNVHIDIVGVGVCAPVCVHTGLHLQGCQGCLPHSPATFYIETEFHWHHWSLIQLVQQTPCFCVQAWRSQVRDTPAHYLLRMWDCKLWIPSLSSYLSHLPNPSLFLSRYSTK